MSVVDELVLFPLWFQEENGTAHTFSPSVKTKNTSVNLLQPGPVPQHLKWN